MKIDAHNHPDWHGHGFDRYLQNMDDHAVDVTWLLSWIVPADEYAPTDNAAMPPVGEGPIPFERCLAYVERAPERFVLGYAPDPRRPDAIDRLRAAVEIYGVRFYGELKLRMRYDNPDAVRLFRFCGEQGLPVTVHIDYEIDTGVRYPRPNWWYGGGVEALETALRACPETTFIGHAPGFWAHISADGQHDKVAYPTGPVIAGGEVPRLLATYPNLYADLSANSARTALSRDMVHAREFVLTFQDRLLYARDGFGGELDALLAQLELPADVMRKLMCENALRLVPLA